jgi:glycosyltransferase involved in cell wall biosynthesis
MEPAAPLCFSLRQARGREKREAMGRKRQDRPGVLLALSYYLPNVSGLTISAAELARVLAAAGHPVTVATSRPRGAQTEEMVGGVRVLRARVWARIGKAPLMPGYAAAVIRGLRGAGLVGIHLPNADAALVAVIARLMGRRVMLSYACSMSTATPGGRAIRALAALSHLVAGLLADRIQVVSQDYAAQSTFCRLFRRKLVFAPPPIPALFLADRPPPPPRDPSAPLRVAYVGRLARQKSLDLLLTAFDGLQEALDRPVVLDLIGPAEGIVGEADWKAVLARTGQSGGRIRHLGTRTPEELAALYPQIDLLVLASTDRLESFGLVQVEAMAAGVPCVATDRPGMAEPIRQTGMGLLFAPATPEALRAAMAKVLTEGPPRRASPADLRRLFGPQVSCAPYLAMLAP